MEEQRIGFMYLNLIQRRLERFWDGLFPRGLRRSSALPFIVIALVIAIPLIGWTLHMHGRFGALKREIKGDAPSGPPAGPRPGGMDPIVLTRNQTAGSNMPEFHTATLLPGMGLEALQITAFLPGRGDVPLLVAPTLQAVADGTAGPHAVFGAVQTPWSGLLTGVLTPVGNTFRAAFQGHTIEAPSEVQGHGSAVGGLLNLLGADEVRVSPLGDSSSVEATFRSTDFDGRWTSRNDISMTFAMGARTIDLTVHIKNVGDQPEPMGVGWQPQFVIPSGNREAAEIHLPAAHQLQLNDRARGLPTGRFIPTTSSIAHFQSHPAAIGLEPLDEILTHLTAGLMDNGPTAEIRDPASEFGLRMTAISSSIHSLHVTSPVGANYVSLGMQTNYDDPLGKQWRDVDDPAIVTLLPGQTLDWKVRLEIFSVANRSAMTR